MRDHGTLGAGSAALAVWAVLGWAALNAGEPAGAGSAGLKPAPGEKRLNAEGTEKVLAALQAAFQKHPCVRAKFEIVSNDPLLSQHRERGELLLERPAHALRRFTRKGRTWKAWALDGKMVREYNAALEKVVERDFSRAPRALALIRAAVTVDVAALKKYFDFTVFEQAANGTPRHWRMVLIRRPGSNLPKRFPYERFEVRITEGQPFFSRITKVPKRGHGNTVTENYREIRAVPALSAKDFHEPLLEKPPKDKEYAQELKAAKE